MTDVVSWRFWASLYPLPCEGEAQVLPMFLDDFATPGVMFYTLALMIGLWRTGMWDIEIPSSVVFIESSYDSTWLHTIFRKECLKFLRLLPLWKVFICHVTMP